MDSIAWSESWGDVYASPGTRKKFANGGHLEKIIRDTDDKMGDSKRNLKERFFEELLNREEGDGFRIICLIDKLSKDFEKSGMPSTLNRILDEWEKQSEVAETPDTLFYVLSKRIVEPGTDIYLKCALTMQSRRVRKGSNVNNRNRRVARRLIRHAQQIQLREDSEIPEFAGIPLEHFNLWVELQAVLCDARFSNWKTTVDRAKKLHSEIERNETSLCKHAHRPDIWLKWWTWDVRHRAAAVCRDKGLFIKSQNNMKELKRQSKENLRGYFAEQEGRKMHGADIYSENSLTHKELKTVDEFIISWVKFDRQWKMAKEYRRGGSRGAGSGGVEDEKKKKWYDDFSNGLQGLNEYFLYGAPGRPRFVKHSYSTDKSQKEERCKKILAEISHARMMLVLSDTHLYCYLLEILHRLLVYRMWWESINYPTRKEDVQAKGISICFDPRAAAEILKEIRRDMRLKHINNRWKREIDSSIKCFEFLDRDRESEPEDDRDAHLRLRDLLDVMKERGERYFLETNYYEEEEIVCSIFGIPYRPHDKNAYELMDPNRRPTGWTTSAIEIRETLD
mgnify:CR=1 FL=1